MKKPIFVFCTFLSSIFFLNAQTTNTFPASGNVGVGTLTPSYKLDVLGTGRFASNVTVGSLGLEGISGGGVIKEIGSNIAFGDIDDTWANVAFYGYGVEKMRYNSNTGNFSIGNTNNLYKLDVTGSGRFSGTLWANDKIILANNKLLTFVSYNYHDFYIGSDNAKDALHIGYGNAVGDNVQMTFDEATNRVGIGTTTPAAKLDVENGDLYVGEGVSSNGNSRQIRVYGFDNGAKHYGSLHSNYDESKRTFDINTSNDVQQIKIDASANPTANILLNPGISGSVGIGTTSPSEKLHVNGLIRIPSATNEDNNSPGIVLASNDDFLYDGQYLNHYGFGFHGYQDGSTAPVEPSNTYMSGYFGVDFFTSGQNRMRISNDGIVSIGTVNRQIGYKLAVNGNIKAKEIKVETGWSDFVFENNYNLPTLKEVEQHIKEKGHLKDIPSAKEVAENGILLGDMNAKLLQKIEELTLYTIEQEKQLEKQEILIKQQDEVNQELKDRLLRLEQLVLNTHQKN